MIAAGESAAAYLQPQTLVSLESTTYPGPTFDVVRPILEASGLVAGVNFNLALSPERIDSGNQQFGRRNTRKGSVVTPRKVPISRKICLNGRIRDA